MTRDLTGSPVSRGMEILDCSLSGRRKYAGTERCVLRTESQKRGQMITMRLDGEAAQHGGQYKGQ